MSEYSGKDGAIANVAAVRQWSIPEGYSLNAAVHSGSAGQTDRSAGIYDWKGSASGYGATLPFNPGTLTNVSFYKGPNAAGSLAAGEIFSGSVYIEQLVLNWDFEKNTRLNWSLNFGGNGALSITSGAKPSVPVEDYTTPCSGKFCLVDDAAVETIIPHLKSATLTFTRTAVTAVNSGDAAGAGKCLTKRRKGPALDWTLALVCDDSNENSALASGTIVRIRGYVDATRKYDLKWGIMGERSNLNVDIEGGKIIGQTYNASMKALKAGVLGDVLDLAGASMVI